LQVLPTDALPVTSWSDRDKAFADIAREIRKTVKELQISLRTKQEWLDEGYAFHNLKCYEEALAAYEQAIRLDPNYAMAYYNKGFVLSSRSRYEEALTAFEQTLRLDPNNAGAYCLKGNALSYFKRYEEALTALEQAIRLDPDDAGAYRLKGDVLRKLGRD